MFGARPGKLHRKIGKLSDTDVQALARYLSSVHPAKTADAVAAETAIAADTVRKWLAGEASPSWRAFTRLLRVYGPELLAALMPDLTWASEAARAATRARLARELDALDAAIEGRP